MAEDKARRQGVVGGFCYLRSDWSKGSQSQAAYFYPPVCLPGRDNLGNPAES